MLMCCFVQAAELEGAGGREQSRDEGHGAVKASTAVVRRGALLAVNINQFLAPRALGSHCRSVTAEEPGLGTCKTSSQDNRDASKQDIADII